jgi:hypothetical protein
MKSLITSSLARPEDFVLTSPYDHRASGELETRSFLFQSLVFVLSAVKDWNVGIGIFPECKEVLVGNPGLRHVSCER